MSTPTKRDADWPREGLQTGLKVGLEVGENVLVGCDDGGKRNAITVLGKEVRHQGVSAIQDKTEPARAQRAANPVTGTVANCENIAVMRGR